MKKLRLLLFLNLLLLLVLQQFALGQYKGTASVTKGLAKSISSNLYNCDKGRIAEIGTIVSIDSKEWIVPSDVHFVSKSFPSASDLNNPCTSANYANKKQALDALNANDIITIDQDGELITAFIFADNYFEIYINGIAVGKDNVPYTQFNSNIVRFKAKRPFTIAMLLVDWEENLGIGSEANGPSKFHNGDGGMVAVFMDEKSNIIAKTDESWKAQTFYTSPISDLSCPEEINNKRLTDKCSSADLQDGTNAYALHWEIPENWMQSSFDDSNWPNAYTFTNSQIGVDNKVAYTNFTDIFDNPSNDAKFIWSSNVILDNQVLARYTVKSISSIEEGNNGLDNNYLFENQVELIQNQDFIKVEIKSENAQMKVSSIEIFDSISNLLYTNDNFSSEIYTDAFANGVYFVKINGISNSIIKKIVICK